ncbi:unnamed protein product [Spirodela intermedia]|uniref:Uncharacterized protein n=1 Tax=Spirodela intermedia TaxID=51605 RepID=A0A7I8IHH9_SPIIN|nr:unnamed protein product [Spirodela intermedia]CAA6657331.1 unnamed protein product [Spirodela intermedia]
MDRQVFGLKYFFILFLLLYILLLVLDWRRPGNGADCFRWSEGFPVLQNPKPSWSLSLTPAQSPHLALWVFYHGEAQRESPRPNPSIPKGEKIMKRKKKSAKRLLSAPGAAAQKSAQAVLENPFENIYSRRKLDVIGKKRKGEDRSRRKTLLKDYEQSRKSSMFVDKRIGEADNALGEFDKGILRLQRERQQKLKKVNKYKLSDGEEDESEHYKGKLLSDVDDFQDDVPLDDDEADYIQKDSAAMRHLNYQSTHEPLEPSLLEEENRHKTKKEVMQEIIAKSNNGEGSGRTSDRTARQRFASLLQSKAFLSLSQPNEANALKELPTKGHSKSESKEKALAKEQSDAYDKLVKELPMERRARPSDRKKTAEEIAQDERERLEFLEKNGWFEDSDDDEAEDDDSVRKSAPKKSKHVSGDDLGDSLLSGDDLAKKTCHIDDIVRSKFGANTKIENSDNSRDDESDETSGNDDNSDDDRNDDEDSSDEEEEDDEDSDGNEGNSDMPLVKDWEQSEDDNVSTDDEEMKNSELENVKSQGSKYNSPGKRDTNEKESSLIEKKSLPFLIEAPTNIRDLCSLIDNRPEAEIVEAINRIRVCNAIRLSTENRRKMQVFYGVLLQYFAVLATRNPINFKLLNLLVKPLVEMGTETPYFTAICARERLLRIRNQFCENVKNPEESAWPSLKTLFLLRLWSLTFPCSDFRHIVMTPATLLMCEYLMRCPIVTGRDTAVGSFLCSMLLSVAKQSQNIYPEALMFLQLLLTSATEKPGSQKLSGVKHLPFFCRFQILKPWLYLRYLVSSVDPVNFFSIMSMPADSPFFLSDNFRASILSSVVETLRGFVNIYENLVSFPEIFMPMSSLLDEVIEQANLPDFLNMEAVTDLIKKKADKHETLRLPLQMRKQKPAPIKLLNPKFEEEFAKGRDYDPDRERVERKKLKKLLKKEAKGAVRELRKDNYFLHEVKKKERVLMEEEKVEMYGKARAFLQEQEHAYKSGQLGKGKKGNR